MLRPLSPRFLFGRPEFLPRLVLGLFCCLCCWFQITAGEPSRPNVLLILADDLGFADLGCYGSEIATPNLDRLAARGVKFTQFYNTARCWPTRSALLTGYYPQQIHMDPPQGLVPPWTRTLAHHLSALGYRSYHAGKWHVPGLPRTCQDGGFDHSYRLEDHDRNFNPRNLVLDDQKLPPVAAGSGYYTATAFADDTIRSLQSHAVQHPGQPFFAYLAFTTPHFPLQAPPEDIVRYRDRYLVGWEKIRAARFEKQRRLGLNLGPLSSPEPQLRAPSGPPGVEAKIDPGEVAYALSWESLNARQRQFQATKMAIHAAMVDRIDQEVGRVLNQLQAMGAWEQTLVFFLSDNGASAEMLVRGDGHDPAAEPGSAGSYLCLGPGWSTVANTPFRRHKIWVHEGGISTPLIAHWPAGLRARNGWSHNVGHVVDLVPTILELVGAPQVRASAEAPLFPGQSLAATLRGRSAGTARELFWHHENNRALRAGPWKIVSAPDDPMGWHLYNLAHDRGETRDLARSHAVRVRHLAARWQSLEEEFQRQAGPVVAKTSP